MALPNVFSKEVTDSFIHRINQLTAQTTAKWGKMGVAEMLAHCCVTYEYVFETKHKPNGFFRSLLLKLLIKSQVVNEVMYKQSIPTGPDFLIKDQRDFEIEKQRLISFVQKVHDLGEQHFDGLKSHSFGVLTAKEWNNMFYKHLHHHLTQFGV